MKNEFETFIKEMISSVEIRGDYCFDLIRWSKEEPYWCVFACKHGNKGVSAIEDVQGIGDHFCIRKEEPMHNVLTKLVDSGWKVEVHQQYFHSVPETSFSDQNKKIYEMYESGISSKKIGIEFGISSEKAVYIHTKEAQRLQLSEQDGGLISGLYAIAPHRTIRISNNLHRAGIINLSKLQDNLEDILSGKEKIRGIGQSEREIIRQAFGKKNIKEIINNRKGEI